MSRTGTIDRIWRVNAARLALTPGLVSGVAYAQTLADPGFETPAVTAGAFIRPVTGPWLFFNDAAVVRPVAPNSSLAVLSTWSATRPAYAGDQYATTYAGADMIRQEVAFDAPGVYELSVQAFAPDGTLTIPGVFVDQPLVSGGFRFWFDSATTGPQHVVPAGSEWQRYAMTISVPSAGSYPVGVANGVAASYFINYDDFQITLVPEPTGGVALAFAAAALVAQRRRRRAT